MDKDAALKLVRQFRESLRANGVRVARVILFGSHAMGTAREDSDIDLIVISPDFSAQELWDRLQLMAPSIWETHTPMEVIPMTPEEWEEGSMVKEMVAGGVDV